jgi:hypothetical protein
LPYIITTPSTNILAPIVAYFDAQDKAVELTNPLTTFLPSGTTMTVLLSSKDEYENIYTTAEWTQLAPTALYVQQVLGFSDSIYFPAPAASSPTMTGKYTIISPDLTNAWLTQTTSDYENQSCPYEFTQLLYQITGDEEVIKQSLVKQFSPSITTLPMSPANVLFGAQRPGFITQPSEQITYHDVTTPATDIVRSRKVTFNTLLFDHSTPFTSFGSGDISPAASQIVGSSSNPSVTCPVAKCNGNCCVGGTCTILFDELVTSAAATCTYTLFSWLSPTSTLSSPAPAVYSFTTETTYSKYRCRFGTSTTYTTCDDAGLAQTVCNSGTGSACTIPVTRACYNVSTGTVNSTNDKCLNTTQYDSNSVVSPAPSTCSAGKVDQPCTINYQYYCRFEGFTTFRPCTQAGLANTVCNADADSICTVTLAEMLCYLDGVPVQNLNDCRGQSVSSPWAIGGTATPPYLGCGSTAVTKTCRVKASAATSSINAPATLSATRTPPTYQLTLKDSSNNALTKITDSVIELRLVAAANYPSPDCTGNNICAVGTKMSSSPHYSITPLSLQSIALGEYKFYCRIDGVPCTLVDGVSFRITPGKPVDYILKSTQTRAMVGDYDEIFALWAYYNLPYLSHFYAGETNSFEITTFDEFGNRLTQANQASETLMITIPFSQNNSLSMVCVASDSSAAQSYPKGHKPDGSDFAALVPLVMDPQSTCIWDSAKQSYILSTDWRWANFLFQIAVLSYNKSGQSTIFSPLAFAVTIGKFDMPGVQQIIYTRPTPDGTGTGETGVISNSPTPFPDVLEYSASTYFFILLDVADKFKNTLDLPIPYAKPGDSRIWPTDFFGIEISYNRTQYKNFGLDAVTFLPPNVDKVFDDRQSIYYTFKINGALEFTVASSFENAPLTSHKFHTAPYLPASASNTPSITTIVTHLQTDSSIIYSFANTITFSIYDRLGNPTPDAQIVLADIVIERAQGGDLTTCPQPTCSSENCCDPTTGVCTLLINHNTSTDPTLDTICNYYLPYLKYNGFLTARTNDKSKFTLTMPHLAPPIYEYRCLITETANLAIDNVLDDPAQDVYVVCTPSLLPTKFCSSVNHNCNVTPTSRYCYDKTNLRVVNDNNCVSSPNANYDQILNPALNDMVLGSDYFIQLVSCTPEFLTTGVDLQCAPDFVPPAEVIVDDSAAPSFASLFITVLIVFVAIVF